MKKNLFKLFLVIPAAALMSVSCTKDNGPDNEDNKGKVLIINQGNFTEQSSSISLYDENTNQIQNRFYETANGVSIGATINSGISHRRERLHLYAIILIRWSFSIPRQEKIAVIR